MSLHDAGLLSPVFADAGLNVPKVNELLEGKQQPLFHISSPICCLFPS